MSGTARIKNIPYKRTQFQSMLRLADIAVSCINGLGRCLSGSSLGEGVCQYGIALRVYACLIFRNSSEIQPHIIANESHLRQIGV